MVILFVIETVPELFAIGLVDGGILVFLTLQPPISFRNDAVEFNKISKLIALCRRKTFVYPLSMLDTALFNA